MKIRKSSKKSITLLASSIIAVVLVAGSVLAFPYISNIFNFSSRNDAINYDEPTSEQGKIGADIKRDTIDKDEDSVSAGDPKMSNGFPDTPTGVRENNLPVKITVSEVDGSTLYIRSEITGIYSTGSCSLNLAKGSQIVKKESGVQPLAQVSTCKGFNIPVSEFTQGTWNVTLIVTVEKKKGTASTTVNL